MIQQLKQQITQCENQQQKSSSSLSGTTTTSSAQHTQKQEAYGEEDNVSVTAKERLYWEQFSRSDQQKQCDGEYGFQLIDSWRKAAQVFCSPANSNSEKSENYENAPTPVSTVTCHPFTQARHAGPDNFCHAKNIYVRMDMFGDQIRPEVPTGALMANCEAHKQRMNSRNVFPLYLEQFMRRMSMKNMNVEESGDNKVVCQRYERNKRFIFMKRDGWANMFHSFSDIVNVFQSLLLYKKDITHEEMRDNVIVLFDDDPEGPYYGVWSAFGTVMRLSEFKKKYMPVSAAQSDEKNGSGSGGAAGGAVTCFENVLFGIPGGSNFIWKDGWHPNACTDSLLLRSFAKFIMDHMKVKYQRKRSRRDKINVTLSSRRGKVRVITNEDEIVNAINQSTYAIEGSSNDGTKTPVPINVVHVDFSNISFKEQMDLIANTDILIGMHGAGLTHLLWLPEESVVLEVFAKEHYPTLFRHLARLTKKTYLPFMNVHQENHNSANLFTKIDVPEFLKVFNAAVKVMQTSYDGTGIQQFNNRDKW